MRLVTFNICSARSLRSGTIARSALGAAVSELHADVLALQEVDRGQPRSGGLDQAAEVARVMGCAPGNWRFAATLNGTPGGDWTPAAESAADTGSDSDASAPAYGIALFSQLPVLEWSQIRLPAAPVRAPVAVAGKNGRPSLLLLRDEPRIALVAVLDTARGPLTVVTSHLSFVPGWNVRQLRQLQRDLADRPRPLVLAGDLNLPGRVPSLVTGWQPLIRAKTFPSAKPRVQLDHLLGDGITPNATGVATPLQISDHRALVIDLPD